MYPRASFALGVILGVCLPPRYPALAMRVLLVSHLFPPNHSAGTEVYTAELGVRLAARGHDVHVFTTDKDVGREDLSLRRYEHRGLPVIELTNNLFHADFRETWDQPEIAHRFAEVVDEFAPDVVHFQHLMYLGVGALEAARERVGTVLYTLHDFWLSCPRMGQLVHADQSVCHIVDHARCGTCLPSFGWQQTKLARRTGRALARVQSATGVDLAPLARGAARGAGFLARGGSAAVWRKPPADLAEVFIAHARRRDEELRRRVVRSVDRFLAPSRFLGDRLVAWGLPSERLHYLPTGIDTDAFAAPQRTHSERLRVAFLGTLVPLKGAHVLLTAWGLLTPEERARAELTVYGPGDHAPDYVRKLRASAADFGAHMPGALTREEVPRALARTDLLVVPSLWFENRPLVQLEALSAGVPQLVSDLGGMAELVTEGRDGWLFPMGDAAALAQRLSELIADPTALAGLTPGADGEALPSWDTFTDRVLEHYRAAGAPACGS